MVMGLVIATPIWSLILIGPYTNVEITIPIFEYITSYSPVHTAGLSISDTHTKNQFANEPEGLRHFRGYHWKALGKENPILSGPFLFRHYFENYTE